MQVRKLRRIVHGTQSPQLQSYHKGPILTNGALEYIYEKPVAWPLYTLWGIGIRTLDQFSIFPSKPQFRAELALTNAPIYGPGVPAGSIQLQGLLEEPTTEDD